MEDTYSAKMAGAFAHFVLSPETTTVAAFGGGGPMSACSAARIAGVRVGQADCYTPRRSHTMHGVTTTVMGNCGFTLAPASKAQRHLVVRNLERAEDIHGLPREMMEREP